MFDAPAFDGFAGRTRRDQVLTVLGGAVACLVGYLGAVALLNGDVSTSATGRIPLAVASVACWGYYALAFVRARGGPVLDALLYPMLTVGVAPTVVRWLVVGPDPGGIFEQVLSLSLDPVVTVAFAILPGIGWFGVILALWSSRLDESQRREWEQTHLTPAFRAEFLDESEE